jgi:hypothetical protein
MYWYAGNCALCMRADVTEYALMILDIRTRFCFFSLIGLRWQTRMEYVNRFPRVSAVSRHEFDRTARSSQGRRASHSAL